MLASPLMMAALHLVEPVSGPWCCTCSLTDTELRDTELIGAIVNITGHTCALTIQNENEKGLFGQLKT